MSTVTATIPSASGEALAQEFEEVFREHCQFIYRSAYSVTGNRQDAEDVLQNIFVKLIERDLPSALMRNPKAYLYRAAVNLALNANINTQNGCSAGSAAEIDPARFAIFGKNLVTITAMAYFGSTFQACFYAVPLGLLSGGEAWTRTDGFDIQAAIPTDAFTSSPTLRDPKLQKMLQTMLAERFKLVLKREMKEMPVYVMTFKDSVKAAATSDGAWLTRRPDNFPQESESRQGLVAQEGPGVYGANATMTDLAQLLGRMVGRPVVDRTGFTRKFSFSLEYEFDASPVTRSPLMGARNPSEIKSLIAEFEKQAGIRLESSKENVEVLVIDHAEKPSEN